MEPGPPDKGAKKSERVNGRGETIVRLRALGFCTVQLLQEWADLSSRDHIGELSVLSIRSHGGEGPLQGNATALLREHVTSHRKPKTIRL